MEKHEYEYMCIVNFKRQKRYLLRRQFRLLNVKESECALKDGSDALLCFFI